MDVDREPNDNETLMIENEKLQRRVKELEKENEMLKLPLRAIVDIIDTSIVEYEEEFNKL